MYITSQATMHRCNCNKNTARLATDSSRRRKYENGLRKNMVTILSPSIIRIITLRIIVSWQVYEIQFFFSNYYFSAIVVGDRSTKKRYGPRDVVSTY